MATEILYLQKASDTPENLPHKDRNSELDDVVQYVQVKRVYPDGTVVGVIMANEEDVKAANPDKPLFVLDSDGYLTDVKVYDNDGLWTSVQWSTANLLDGAVTGIKLADAIAGDGLTFTTVDGVKTLHLSAALTDLAVSPWAIIDFDTVDIPIMSSTTTVPITTANTRTGGDVTVTASGFTVPTAGMYKVDASLACVSVDTTDVVQLSLTGVNSAVIGTVQQASAGSISLWVPASGLVELAANTTYSFKVGRTTGSGGSPQVNGADTSSQASVVYWGPVS